MNSPLLNTKTMALELTRGVVRIPAKGILLNKDSTQEELKRALKHEPKLSQFIIDSKKQAKDDKTSN